MCVTVKSACLAVRATLLAADPVLVDIVFMCESAKVLGIVTTYIPCHRFPLDHRSGIIIIYVL